jgi:hypothetical protein
MIHHFLLLMNRSPIGGCFLEEKLKPRKKTATNQAGLKDNGGE